MNPILPEDEVNIQNLVALLENAAISHVLDDGDIHVTEFPSSYFLLIDTNKKILRFHTCAPVRSTNTEAVLDFANHCNNEIVMIRFSHIAEAQRFCGDYSLPYRGGVLREHILRIAREFPDHFNYVCSTKDEDDLLGKIDPSEAASIYNLEEERRYRQACQMVIENQKASASWLQRQLGVGYNIAAKWVERMEVEGLVSQPNNVGRRELYRDKNGNPV